MKKIWKNIILGAVLLALLPQSVAAAVNNEATYTIDTNEIKNWPQGPEVFSDTAVLMDADSGAVLYSKGMDEVRYPASITKIMTALLALENTKLTDQVTFTSTGLQRMGEGTNIQMQVGEVLTMEQCLHALLIQSANEVADQIAEVVGGSQEGFAEMMNARASELGCKNTHFHNPSGLPDEEHWTSAYDMALIFREALKNEEFRKIIATLDYTIPATNMTATPREFHSHHALLVPSAPEYYEGCLGGKTGVTQVAKNTLVTGVERNGITYIAVVMRAEPGEVCADTKALFDYGYNSFTKLAVTGGSLIVPKGVEESALECVDAQTDTHAVFNYSYNDHLVGSVTISLEELQKMEAEAAAQKAAKQEQAISKETPENEDASGEDTNQKIKEDEQMKATYRLVIVVLGALILLALLITIIKVSVRRKKKKK